MNRSNSQTLSFHFASFYSKVQTLTSHYKFFTTSRRRHHHQPLLSQPPIIWVEPRELKVVQVGFSVFKLEIYTHEIESWPSGVFCLQIQNSNTPGFVKVMDSSTNAPSDSTQADIPPSVVSKTGNGRKKSLAWNHFEKVKVDEGVTMAVCNYCKKSYHVDSKSCGTSNLLAYMTICPKNSNREDKGQKTLAFEPKNDGDEGFKLVSTTFSVEASRKALAEMIIIDELPFRCVEGYGFKKYVTTLQPKLCLKDILSRQTVARDVIEICNCEREKLRKSLKGCRVCLTTDTWTSIQNLNYMCLTCHFIDDAWKLHKRILNFCQVEDHKGETIGRKIEMSLREWGINGIFTLTVDNASSNLTTIKFLQRVRKDWNGTVLENEFMHMRCCAHILNLIVGEGLKEIDASVARVREAVRYVKSSPNRNQTFRNFMERLGMESKSFLCLDVPTRWNSTYLMLETAEKFEKVFLRMDFEDDGYSSYFRSKEDSGGLGSPCMSDFQNCRAFVTFLRLFYNATKKFSGSLYVTSNAFFDEIFVIQESISQLVKSQNTLLKNTATNMQTKFEKYWGEGGKINPLLYVAVILDPQKKLRFLKFSFSEIYGNEVGKVMVDKVKDLLMKLYTFYCSVNSPNMQEPSGSERTQMVGDASDPYVMVHSRYELFLEAEQSVGCSNEVEKYLVENCDGRRDVNFEVLGWWKDNCSRYPMLSKVAKDVLAVPVSTVASESAFSTGDHIVDPFLSSLSPLMVQNLVCAQNWLQATVPISYRQSKDEVEALEEEFHDLVLNQQSSSSASASTSSNLGSSSGKRPLISVED
ncbi:zinc finger BED domain-containing protein RICESLEEPER 2-like [Castanea sativa]|uniref:zinc finger BED domain-containing protein RICESLEEPER 2-like n=1 Tax=Castanea sativa TaxID=21020 RepID=UPI003F653F77